MKRRTLDVLFSVGGVVLAGLLLVAGIVLSANAKFANDYVADQLGQQHITFKSADTLTEEEAQQPCLVEYAGQQLTTGKQAECYANHFIGVHLQSIGGGLTYSELGEPQSELRTQVAEAQQNNSPDLADLQAQLDQVNSQRETVFKGEMLRGALLTSYGFSEFGTKAGQAAIVAFIAAGLLFLLAIAGFVHAYVTPRSELFAAPDGAARKERVPA